jgi:hypothetical protein
MKFWHFLLGGLAVVLAFNAWLHYRQRKLAQAREGQGFNEFAPYFSGEGIPLYKLREVFLYFQNWQTVKNFPVNADDDICGVYGICDEDLDDAVEELAKAWGVQLLDPAESLRMPPVRTVADLVRFLARRRPAE